MFYDLMFVTQLFSKLIYNLTALWGANGFITGVFMASWPEFKVIKSGVQSNKMCNFGFLLFNLELNRVFYVWIDFDQDKSGLTLVKTKWLDKMVGPG